MGTLEISVILLFPILQGHNTLPHFVGIILCWNATIWEILFEFEMSNKDQVLSNWNDEQLVIWILIYKMNPFIPHNVGFKIDGFLQNGEFRKKFKLNLPHIVVF